LKAVFSGGDANFRDAEFNKCACFNFAMLNGSASFEDAEFIGNAYFENAAFGRDLNLNRTGYSRLFLHWNSINKSQFKASDYDAYLALERNYVNLGWFEDANNCYYEYRNKRRVDTDVPFIEKATDTIEWVSYGYGVKPIYTLGWIAFFVLVFGMIFTYDECFKKYIREDIKISPEDKRAKDHTYVEIITILREDERINERINYFTDTILFSLTTFTSGFFSFLHPSIEYKFEKHTRWVILERLLGTLFIALLITAISKTYLIR